MPRAKTAAGVTEQEVVEIRQEVAAGKPVTVWFTAAAVGVPEGRSAKVVSVDDLAEGDFIQVRAAGSRDTMFCSPGELSRVRPARKPAATTKKPVTPSGAAGPAQPGETAPAEGSDAGKPSMPVAESASADDGAADDGAAGDRAVADVPAPPAPATPKRTAAHTASHTAARTPAHTAAPETEAEPVADTAPHPARGGRRPVAKPAEVTVSLTSTAEGEWSVEVLVGKRRAVRATPLQPADVAAVARALPPEIAETIESSLEGARQRQRERVDRLRAELDAAQQALEELGA